MKKPPLVDKLVEDNDAKNEAITWLQENVCEGMSIDQFGLPQDVSNDLMDGNVSERTYQSMFKWLTEQWVAACAVEGDDGPAPVEWAAIQWTPEDAKAIVDGAVF